MAITTAMRDEVVELYIALFGRAPDSEGLGYWASQYDTRGGNLTALQSVAQDMYNTTAARSYYPLAQTNNEYIAAVYQNVFGRTADADGLSYWAGRLSSISKGAVVAEMIDAVLAYNTAQTTATNTALNTSLHSTAVYAKDMFVNKREVAEYFSVTKALNDLDRASAILLSVTNNTATVSDAKSALDTVGTTISLTTNVDTAIGGSGNDLFSASVGTIQGGDSIDGKDGADIFRFTDAAGAGAAPTISNVERIDFISNGTGLLSLANAAGYTSLNIWGNGVTATVNGLSSAAITIGVLSGFGGDLTVGLNDQTGPNDTLMLKVGAASGFGLIESAFNFEALSIEAMSGTGVAITAAMASALSSISITGSANVTLDVDRESTNTGNFVLNATALQGNLTLTLGSRLLGTGNVTAGNIVVNAGTGNDVVVLDSTGLGSSFGSSLSLNGGAGNDTLRMNVQSGVTRLPSAVGFETLDVIAGTGAAGETATLNFTSITGSLSTINLWGASTAAELRNMTAGATINVVSGFGGTLNVTLLTETGTADSITIVSKAASGFELHASANAIETINFQVNCAAFVSTAGALSAFEFGSSVTNFNISGDQNVTLRMAPTGVNTALTISSTGLTAGNLNLTLEVLSNNQQLVVNAGTGNDTISLASGTLHTNMTATFDGGAGTDTLGLTLDTGGNLAPSVSNFETLTLVDDHNSAQFNGSGLSAISTLNVQLGSNASASLAVSKLASSVSAINISLFSSNTTANASANQVYAFNANPGSVTLNINPTVTGAGNTAVLGSITVQSATVVTFNYLGSNNLSAGDLVADQATALTIQVGSGASGIDAWLSAVSAANAGRVTINATAGDIVIGTAGFHTASLVTINAGQAGSTGTWSGSRILHMSASRADLTITVGGNGGSANTAGLIISTAIVRDDVSITTNSGDVIIGELRLMDSAIASSVAGNLTLTLAANASADTIIINSISVGTGGTANTGAHNLVLNISGSGDVTIASGILATGAASNNTANTINATGLFGTLIIGFSATESANFTVNLGNDQASANNIQLGNGNDTINGGSNADLIEGGVGQDTIDGGGGNDFFMFLSSAAQASADQLTGQNDFILNFASGDRIEFSGIDALTTAIASAGGVNGTALSGLGAVSAIYTASLVGFTAASGNVLAVYQASGNTYIEVSLVSAAPESGVVTIVLDGVSGWTALSSLLDITVGAACGLVIRRV